MALDVPAAEVDTQGPPGQGLAAATFVATAFRLAALPLAFATTIITSRYLLPEGRGSFVLALLTVTLAWTLLSNVMVGITKEIGREGRPAPAMLAQGLALAVVLGFAGIAVLVPLDLVLSTNDRIVVVATAALPAMLVTQNIGGALLPLSRFREWNVLQLLPQLFVFIGMLILVVALNLDLTGAVAAWTMAQIVVAGVGLYLARDIWLAAARRRSWLQPNRMRAMLRLGVALGVVNLVATLNYRIELFVLQAARGLGEVGVYSVAASLAEFAWLPVGALAAVATPAIVNSARNDAITAVTRSARQAFMLTIGFAAVVGVVGYLLIPTVFGNQFAGARTPLVILLPAIVVFAPAKVIAVYLSGRLGRPMFQFGVAATSTVTTAGAAAALTPRMGMNGAALSTVVGYSAGMVLEVAMLSRFDVPLRSLVPRVDDLRAYPLLAHRAVGRLRRYPIE